MEDYNKNRENQAQSNQGNKKSTQDQSIGNKQHTAQTGAQNAGGKNRSQEEDKYTEDLRDSGDRNSSNRKTSS